MTDNTRVFNMDCMEGMKEFPNKWFDLAIVDVNYGIEQDGRNNHSRGLLAKSKDAGNKRFNQHKAQLKLFPV